MSVISTRKRPSIFEILWKIAVIFFASAGVYLQAKLDGGLFKTYIFLYFTILSNMGTAIVFFLLLLCKIAELIRGRGRRHRVLSRIKYIFTMAMALTLIVSLCLLAPFKSQAYLFSFRNLCVHIFAPLGATLDFLIFDKDIRYRLRTSLQSLILPALYLAVTLLISIKGITYSNGENFPYYFLNYRNLGWITLPPDGFGVLWWIVVIGVISLVSAFLITAVKVIIQKCRRKTI